MDLLNAIKTCADAWNERLRNLNPLQNEEDAKTFFKDFFDKQKQLHDFDSFIRLVILYHKNPFSAIGMPDENGDINLEIKG